MWKRTHFQSSLSALCTLSWWCHSWRSHSWRWCCRSAGKSRCMHSHPDQEGREYFASQLSARWMGHTPQRWSDHNLQHRQKERKKGSEMEPSWLRSRLCTVHLDSWVCLYEHLFISMASLTDLNHLCVHRDNIYLCNFLSTVRHFTQKCFGHLLVI